VIRIVCVKEKKEISVLRGLSKGVKHMLFDASGNYVKETAAIDLEQGDIRRAEDHQIVIRWTNRMAW
jgi:hypothetical protein